MARESQKRILIPADAPGRTELEQFLRTEGWLPLAYGDATEAESVLSRAPATAVILRTPRGESKALELVKTVRRVCPDAFLLGVGYRRAKGGPDTVLNEPCSPREVVIAVRLGMAAREARTAERTVREQLRFIEEKTRAQAERIKELEATCTNLRAWAQAVQNLALHDELTGLYNRRYFIQAAEREIQRSSREGSRFVVAMIDIDHFKCYNDAYGHLAGDRLLKNLAGALVENLRRMDTVARYGGEEFIVLMPETRSPKEGVFDPIRLVERVRAAVEQRFTSKDSTGSDSPLTISAGVAQYPADGETLIHLIEEVDARLYRAKAAGRNRICASREEAART